MNQRSKKKEMFDALCQACNGRGYIVTRDEDGNKIEIYCEECDGTGLSEELESFEPYKRTRRNIEDF